MTINTEMLVRILDTNKELVTKSTPKKYWPNFGEDHILGCGEFGCVFDTKSKYIVFKLTTDPKEYKFVVDAMNMGAWPEGMIQYYQAMKLDSAFTRIDFYGLWRESAYEVSSLSDTEVNPDFIQVLDVCWNIAKKYTREVSAKKMYDRGWINWMNDLIDKYIKATDFDVGEFNSILHAMGWYAKHGILLGDVHLGNIGKVKRDGKWMWVITDPGEAVFVEDEILKDVCEDEY